jgi:hypothetical protein
MVTVMECAHYLASLYGTAINHHPIRLDVTRGFHVGVPTGAVEELESLCEQVEICRSN